MQVLRVHRHAADEENRTPGRIGGVRHHRPEWKSRELPRVRREASDTPQRRERTRPFGERWFGYIGKRGSGAGVGSHCSILVPKPVANLTRKIRVVDSHTGGEPTRVVIDGGPDLGGGTMAERLERFRASIDDFRSAVVNEPRGSDVIVGALLVRARRSRAAPPASSSSTTSATSACAATAPSAWWSRSPTWAASRRARIASKRPSASSTATLHDDRATVTVDNVPSYRSAQQAPRGSARLSAPSRGDVAWGGNWFFLVRAITARSSRSTTSSA